MFETAIYPAIFLLTYLGVEAFRRWSLRREFFDVPNERSSHQTPTPRGGGLVLVVVCLVFYTCAALFFQGKVSWGYLSGALLIALISWLDDLYTISFVWRFLLHASAAGLLIAELGFWNEIYLPGFGTVASGAIGLGLTFLWIVWLTNAYNFMDGIDGIAGIQAVTAGIGWLIAGHFGGADIVSLYGGAIAFSALGFLIHNWQPAKIFMGDVGSAFLGFTFAALPLLAKQETTAGRAFDNLENLGNVGNIENIGSIESAAVYPLIGVLAVWLFVFDTLLTFTRRLLKKQKVWTAHREHLYQRMIIGGKTHQAVSTRYGLVSALFFPTVWLIHRFGVVYWFLWLSIAVLQAFMILRPTLRRNN